jgi:hypothetical protein
MPGEATGKTGVPSERRQKPERPRDRLGRPLAWGAEPELHLPDFDAMTLEENHRAGIAFVHAGGWFGAHEAWETAWKQARGSGDEELFKGLSQMGAGYVHLLRGNAHGAVTLWARAEGRIRAYPDGHRGLATGRIGDHLRAHVDDVRGGGLIPSEEATFEPPPV